MQAAIELFKTAILSEVKADLFYSTAAEITEDDESRMLFLELASMEDDHAQALVNRVKKAPCGKEFDGAAYLKDLETSQTASINDDDKEFIKNSSIRDVLAKAISMENEASETYAKLAEASEDAEVKKYCLELKMVELAHARKLTNLLNSMDMEDPPAL